jgi:hypothetical protein
MNESPVTKAANMILVEQIRQLIKERDEARRERDEARREVCESEQYCVDRSREEATRRGWNCYEETP